MILSAFDHFKLVHREAHRFETLMHYFRHYEDFNIDFMVCSTRQDIAVSRDERDLQPRQCHIYHIPPLSSLLGRQCVASKTGYSGTAGTTRALWPQAGRQVVTQTGSQTETQVVRQIVRKTV